MTMPTDVLASGLRYLVTTASGARYVIDARNLHRGPTITRLTTAASEPDDRFPLACLRRDLEPIRVLSVEHVVGNRVGTGVVVGTDMHLTLEPLAADAAFTARRTTPVVRIDLLPDEIEIRDA